MEADDAWCPPTLRPSRDSRRWLAWWMVHAESQWTLRSSCSRRASRRASASADAPPPGGVAAPGAMRGVIYGRTRVKGSGGIAGSSGARSVSTDPPSPVRNDTRHRNRL